ncbi:MAG: hypothetical protein RR785_08995 [Clostridium sp.]
MKKNKRTVFCLLLVCMLVMLTGCMSNKDKPMETTMAPTTSASTESTGVIVGMAEDIKKGANDVKDGVENALTPESSTAH